MADIEKVIKGLGKCSHIGWCKGGNDCPYWNEDAQGKEQYEMCKCLLKDALSVIESQQAEIEQMKAQKQKWLQNIADQQLAVSPTGYETEEGLAKRTGEWNGLQMAWEILTKE